MPRLTRVSGSNKHTDAAPACVGSEDLSHAPPGQQYLAALYFTITTLSTTGFGDVVAQNSLEQARRTRLRLMQFSERAAGVTIFCSCGQSI